MKLYLDLCSLNRPFDDQSQPRVNLEAQAVILILDACQEGRHDLNGSAALDVENGQNPDADRRDKVAAIIAGARHRVPHSRALDERANRLALIGFQDFDAYHVASAEAGGCDRLVTTDDRMLRTAARNEGTLKVRITNPILLIAEASF